MPFLQQISPVDLPADLTFLHLIAISMVFGGWLIYSPALNFLARGTLNQKLSLVRQHWIHLSVHREGKTFDALLLGHITHSVSFFGSATMILLAALLGAFATILLSGTEDLDLPELLESTRSLLLLNLGVIILLLTISFFSFTYSLRKLIYTVALFGALPNTPEHDPKHDILVETAAIVLTEAVKSFNSGIRGYYYTAAAIFLFVDPRLCIFAILVVTVVLFYRQTMTKTSRAIDKYLSCLTNPD